MAESLGAVRRFPIMHGPNVPWEVMEPHEAQAQRNHSQSLQRLAERGGLSPAEAWLVVHDQQWPPGWTKELADEWTLLWGRYAAEVNQRYGRQALRIARLEGLMRPVKLLRSAGLLDALKREARNEEEVGLIDEVLVALSAVEEPRLTETDSDSKGKNAS